MHYALPLLATLGNSRKNFIKHEISKGELIFLWETKPQQILIIPIINYLHLMNSRLLFLPVERAHRALMEFFIPCCVLKHALTKACSDPRYTVLKATIHELVTSMETRYENYLENEHLLAAPTLDPRYKSFLFKTSDEDSSHSTLSQTSAR